MKSAPDLGDGASWLLLYGVQIREQARDGGELVHAVIWRNMCFHTLFAGAGQLFSALCFISIFKCTELSRTDFYTIPCQINSVTPSPVTSPHVSDVFTSYDFKNVLLYLLFKTVIIFLKKWIHLQYLLHKTQKVILESFRFRCCSSQGCVFVLQSVYSDKDQTF